jgi:hypothetical protein
VQIQNNGGTVYGSIGSVILPASIADEYHQWTAAVCYSSVDGMAYWNLWIDGEKLLFPGTEGSVVGPGGGVFSFRTPLNNVTGDPYIGLGELNNQDVWDFEFDWVRMLSYNVEGCPFWDGEGCVPTPQCNIPWADADGDGDVDMDDFAAFQLCYTGHAPGPGVFDEENCVCFDRDRDGDVDTLDFLEFANCATGAGVPWVSTPECP